MKILINLIVIIGILSLPCFGGKTLDPQAVNIFKESIQKYKTLKTYQHKETLKIIRTVKGQKYTQSLKSVLYFKRPNQLLYRHPGIILACDGKKLMVCIIFRKEYIEKPAPPILTAKAFESILPVEQVSDIIVNLLAEDPFAIETKAIKTLKYSGIIKGKDNKEYHKITYVNSGGKGYILIGVNDKLVHQNWFKLKLRSGQSADMVFEYTDIKIDKDIPATKFSTIPPKGTKKVETLFSTRKAKHPLEGKRIPEDKLPLLGSKSKKSIYDLIGKKITFVSFWATWCPPCRKEQPVLQKIYHKYKEKGVTIIGVNVEKPNRVNVIKAFVKKNGLTFPILLDQHDSLSRQLKVRGIPALFIIDNTGKILEVHVGFGPGAEEEYTHIIEKYVGKTPPALKKSKSK